MDEAVAALLMQSTALGEGPPWRKPPEGAEERSYGAGGCRCIMDGLYRVRGEEERARSKQRWSNLEKRSQGRPSMAAT